MVKVRFDKSEDGKSLILTVKGHADQAEIGHDIVCASVSILTYTIAKVVEDLQNGGKLKKRPTIRLESGDAVVTCKPNKAYFSEAFHAFSVVQTGYSLLHHSYPQFVDIKLFD